MKRQSTVRFGYLVLALFLGLPAVVIGMPPGPGIDLPPIIERERTELGVDIITNPVRDARMQGIVNSPGDVRLLVSGTKQFRAVCIKFTDYNYTYSTTSFTSMLFGTWTSGSAKDYFSQVSYNMFTLAGGVSGWYTSTNNKAYYGYSNGSARAATLAKQAAQLADGSVNYATYDNDGDGYVDVFTCIHAGYGAEETGNGSDIWSHSWSFSSAGIGVYTTNDPRPGYPGQYIKIDNYVIDPERSSYSNNGTMVSIGVYCHEWGHALGLPDLYDTDGGGSGLGNWCLMAGGSWGTNGSSPWYPSHLSAWPKMELGWLNPKLVRYNKAYSVYRSEYNSQAYWMMPNQRTFKEWFLLENRQKVGFDVNMYTSGIALYHCDESVILGRRSSNRVNAGGTGWKYGVALEQADGLDQLYSGTNRGNSGDLYPGSTSNHTFNATSNPNSKTNYPLAGPLTTGVSASIPGPSGSPMTVTMTSGVSSSTTGGPDAASYRWIDNDAPSYLVPTYSWTDISTSGSLLGTGDDVRFLLALPFTFKFYGTNYTNVYVSSNGWLSFGADPGTSAPTNTSIPNAGAPNRAVFAYWDDLVVSTSNGGKIMYKAYGTSPNRYLIISWIDARVKGAPAYKNLYNTVTFQIRLYERTNDIRVQYKDCACSDPTRNWGRTASAGIENSAGTVGLQYLYNGSPNGNVLASERCVRYYTYRMLATVLSDDAMVSTSAYNAYKYNQPTNYWNVVGVRSSSDWDIYTYNIDFTTSRANSVRTSGVDFCVSDANHSPLDSMGVVVTRYSGTATAYVEFENASDLLTRGQTNGPYTWTAGDVVEVWDVYLPSGIGGTFKVDITSGTSDLGFALFKSNGATYYAGRSAAVASADAGGAGVDETFTYTSTSSDYYALVVWCNNANSCTYSITVPGPTRRQRAIVLSDDLWQSRSSDTVYKYGQTTVYWNAVGVRPADTTTDWDIYTYNIDFAAGRASSARVYGVDFCVSDANHSPLDSMGVWVHRYSGTGSGTVEFENAADALASGVNGPFTWSASDVVEVWDVFRNDSSYGTYRLDITSGSLDLGFGLFRSNGATYYAGRSAAVVSADAGGVGYDETFNYMAPATDWYGLVVWSNNANSGTFTLTVPTSDTSPSQGPPRSGVMAGTNGRPMSYGLSVRPSPFTRMASINYQMPVAGATSIKLYDITGKLVRVIASGNAEAGYYSRVLNSSGLARGIYVLKFESGGYAATRQLVVQ